MASALCEYPMEVAVKACSPVHGVPRKYKDYPASVGQIVAWCEEEQQWLLRMAGQYDRKPDVAAPVDRSRNLPLSDAIGRAARIMGREVTRDGRIGPSPEMEELERVAAQRRAKAIDDANTRFFRRSYVSEGIPISRALIDTLKDHPDFKDAPHTRAPEYEDGEVHEG